MTLKPEEYYRGFREGDENALNYIYNRYYRSLFFHGKQIVNDDFAVSCIVQEAFLKGWQFRETMLNMRHIYCFIRLDVSWKCYDYLRNPSNQFHRRLVHEDALENFGNHFYDEQADNSHVFDEEKLKVIEEALPYLPANHQTIMTLYFKHGLSYKKIARRFGTSGQSINLEVQKSLESLKNIVHAQKKLDVKPPAIHRSEQHLNMDHMDPEMQQIFKLRYEQKHSFSSIAQKMNINQSYVQQKYVAAHRKLRQLYRH